MIKGSNGLRSLLWIVLGFSGWVSRDFAGVPEEQIISPVTSDLAFRLTLIEENPVLTGDGRDRHYTNGAQISLLSPTLKEDSILGGSLTWLEQNTFLFLRPTRPTDNRFEWIIAGQGIYTPQDHSLINPDPKDRPYAGWLYTGFSWIENRDDHVLTSFEVQAGVVGPWALGRQIQNGFHSIFGIGPAHGWNYQLGNEFGFVLTWDRNWRFDHDLGNGFSWEVIPTVGLAVGDVFTYAQTGGIIRWGKGLKADWGPNLFRPGYPGTAYFDPNRSLSDWGFDFYAGLLGRLVAINVFLDGNTFQNSRHVDKEIPVGDALAGAEIFYRDRLRIGFAAVLRSPEFHQQRGPDAIGAFNASILF
jgi:hypothetical protein